MKIFLSPPEISLKTQAYVAEVLKKGWIAPNGPENKKLELIAAEFYGLRENHALSCSSGTSALHLIYKTIPIEKGDVVFCPSLTFVATINPILQEGGIPWFVDSEEETGGISPELLEMAIQECLKKGGKPKAVVVVNLIGYPAKLKEISELCKKFTLFLVEDAAASLGSKSNKNKDYKSLADATAFSFNGNKIITSSGGGLVLAKENEFAQKCRYYRDQAKSIAPGYWHEQQGFNYALSNISAAIGYSEWLEINEKRAKKELINTWYKEFLSENKEITFFPIESQSEPNFWLTVVFLSHEKRNDVYQKLKNEGIESRYMWTPLHTMPYLKDFPKTLNGTAEKWAKTGICLPSGLGLTQEMVRIICEIGFLRFDL
jgi:dTDP-4-amino-4,6-dideoxygalactose transaminase